MNHKFDCGCEFPVLGQNGKLTKLDISLVYQNINYFCPTTWDLISSGKTKGVFQLETQFAQSFAGKLKPRTLEHLAALGAILRPGPLESGMAEKYIKRKNGEEDAEAFHESLSDILKETFQCLVFQEQSSKIAIEISGMTPAQADKHIRKSLAKKKPELIAEAKKLFLEGAKEKGIVTDEEAEEIFGWIEKGQRYLFNKCLHPLTKVKLHEGRKIELIDLEIGDVIESPSGPTKVKDIIHSGRKQLYQVELNDNNINYDIICSLDHKFDTGNGIFSLKDIFYNGYTIKVKNGYRSIRSIAKYGPPMGTMDIEVDNEDHLFWANEGIATSNSHSVGYAYLSYITAYIKAHFPLEFFWSYLLYAKEEQKPKEEIAELVEDAALFNIDVLPPDIRLGFKEFDIKDGNIYFGITNIKGVGSKNFDDLMELGVDFNSLSWHRMLCQVLNKVNKKVGEGLIKSGALNYLGVSRRRMLFEYKQVRDLKEKELEYICSYDNIVEGLNELVKLPTGRDEVVTQKPRLKKVKDILNLLENPPYNLEDTATDLQDMDVEMLGVPLVCTSLDDSELQALANCSCRDFIEGEGRKKNIIIAGLIQDIRRINTKNGKEMAFLELRDSTCTLKSVVLFPTTWEKYRDVAQERASVLAYGHRSPDRKESFIVDKLVDITA